MRKIWQNLARSCRVLYFQFQSDLCFLRASSLTFQSTLSVVPVLAVMFGIAKGFGFERMLENILRDEFHDQKEVVNYFIQFGYKFLQETQGGVIAGIGIIVLLFTVMRLFSNIEDSLNYMWGIKKGRPLARKASDYLALILICPILIAVSSSATVFITTHLEKLTEPGAMGEQAAPYLLRAIPLIPYVMSTLLFTIVYIVMPYTSVRISSAIWAGLFAGCSYQILQATYISIQIQISHAGAIYGSFAALPLFLVWLYLSWIIFLIGAEIVVIHQERLWDPTLLAPYRHLSPYEKQLASLACVKAAVDAFLRSNPITIKELAQLLKIPERLVTELIDELSQVKMLIKTPTPDQSTFAVVPGKSPETLRLLDVIGAMDGKNGLKKPYVEQLNELLLKIKQQIETSPNNKLFKDISLD